MPDERESRKERKRQSLLAAAYGLFTEKGVAKTSVDEIVRRANVAKGTFYLYFQLSFSPNNMITILLRKNQFSNKQY